MNWETPKELIMIKIKNFLKSKLGLTIIGVFLTALFALLINLYLQERSANKDKDTIIYKQQVQFTDEKGRLVTETTEQKIKISELQAIAKAGDSSKSVLLKEIALMNLKIKNVESMSMAVLKVKDTFSVVPFYDTTIIETIPQINEIDDFQDGFLQLTRVKGINDDTAHYTYNYQDTIVWAVSRYHMEPWKFKNIFVWRDWYYKLSMKSLNPKAQFLFAEYIKISRKRKR